MYFLRWLGLVKGSGWQLAGGVESPTSRLFCHKTAVASYTVANSAKLYCLLEGRKVEGSFDRKQVPNATFYLGCFSDNTNCSQMSNDIYHI